MRSQSNPQSTVAQQMLARAQAQAAQTPAAVQPQAPAQGATPTPRANPASPTQQTGGNARGQQAQQPQAAAPLTVDQVNALRPSSTHYFGKISSFDPTTGLGKIRVGDPAYPGLGNVEYDFTLKHGQMPFVGRSGQIRYDAPTKSERAAWLQGVRTGADVFFRVGTDPAGNFQMSAASWVTREHIEGALAYRAQNTSRQIDTIERISNWVQGVWRAATGPIFTPPKAGAVNARSLEVQGKLGMPQMGTLVAWDRARGIGAVRVPGVGDVNIALNSRFAPQIGVFDRSGVPRVVSAKSSPPINLMPGQTQILLDFKSHPTHGDSASRWVSVPELEQAIAARQNATPTTPPAPASWLARASQRWSQIKIALFGGVIPTDPFSGAAVASPTAAQTQTGQPPAPANPTANAQPINPSAGTSPVQGQPPAPTAGVAPVPPQPPAQQTPTQGAPVPPSAPPTPAPAATPSAAQAQGTAQQTSAASQAVVWPTLDPSTEAGQIADALSLVPARIVSIGERPAVDDPSYTEQVIRFEIKGANGQIQQGEVATHQIFSVDGTHHADPRSAQVGNFILVRSPEASAAAGAQAPVAGSPFPSEGWTSFEMLGAGPVTASPNQPPAASAARPSLQPQQAAPAPSAPPAPPVQAQPTPATVTQQAAPSSAPASNARQFSERQVTQFASQYGFMPVRVVEVSPDNETILFSYLNSSNEEALGEIWSGAGETIGGTFERPTIADVKVGDTLYVQTNPEVASTFGFPRNGGDVWTTDAAIQRDLAQLERLAPNGDADDIFAMRSAEPSADPADSSQASTTAPSTPPPAPQAVARVLSTREALGEAYAEYCTGVMVRESIPTLEIDDLQKFLLGYPAFADAELKFVFKKTADRFPYLDEDRPNQSYTKSILISVGGAHYLLPFAESQKSFAEVSSEIYDRPTGQLVPSPDQCKYCVPAVIQQLESGTWKVVDRGALASSPPPAPEQKLATAQGATNAPAIDPAGAVTESQLQSITNFLDAAIGNAEEGTILVPLKGARSIQVTTSADGDIRVHVFNPLTEFRGDAYISGGGIYGRSRQSAETAEIQSAIADLLERITEIKPNQVRAHLGRTGNTVTFTGAGPTNLLDKSLSDSMRAAIVNTLAAEVKGKDFSLDMDRQSVGRSGDTTTVKFQGLYIVDQSPVLGELTATLDREGKVLTFTAKGTGITILPEHRNAIDVILLKALENRERVATVAYVVAPQAVAQALTTREVLGEAFAKFLKQLPETLHKIKEAESFQTLLRSEPGLETAVVEALYRPTSGIEIYFHTTRGASALTAYRVSIGGVDYLLPRAIDGNRWETTKDLFRMPEHQSARPESVEYCLPAVIRKNDARWDLVEQGALLLEQPPVAQIKPVASATPPAAGPRVSAAAPAAPASPAAPATSQAVARELLTREVLGEAFVRLSNSATRETIGEIQEAGPFQKLLRLQPGLESAEVTPLWRPTAAQVPYFLAAESGSSLRAFRISVGGVDYLLPFTPTQDKWQTTRDFFETPTETEVSPNSLRYCLPAVIRSEGPRWVIAEQGKLLGERPSTGAQKPAAPSATPAAERTSTGAVPPQAPVNVPPARPATTSVSRGEPQQVTEDVLGLLNDLRLGAGAALDLLISQRGLRLGVVVTDPSNPANRVIAFQDGETVRFVGAEPGGCTAINDPKFGGNGGLNGAQASEKNPRLSTYAVGTAVIFVPPPSTAAGQEAIAPVWRSVRDASKDMLAGYVAPVAASKEPTPAAKPVNPDAIPSRQVTAISRFLDRALEGATEGAIVVRLTDGTNLQVERQRAGSVVLRFNDFSTGFSQPISAHVAAGQGALGGLAFIAEPKSAQSKVDAVVTTLVGMLPTIQPNDIVAKLALKGFSLSEATVSAVSPSGLLSARLSPEMRVAIVNTLAAEVNGKDFSLDMNDTSVSRTGENATVVTFQAINSSGLMVHSENCVMTLDREGIVREVTINNIAVSLEREHVAALERVLLKALENREWVTATASTESKGSTSAASTPTVAKVEVFSHPEAPKAKSAGTKSRTFKPSNPRGRIITPVVQDAEIIERAATPSSTIASGAAASTVAQSPVAEATPLAPSTEQVTKPEPSVATPQVSQTGTPATTESAEPEGVKLEYVGPTAAAPDASAGQSSSGIGEMVQTVKDGAQVIAGKVSELGSTAIGAVGNLLDRVKPKEKEQTAALDPVADLFAELAKKYAPDSGNKDQGITVKASVEGEKGEYRIAIADVKTVNPTAGFFHTTSPDFKTGRNRLTISDRLEVQADGKGALRFTRGSDPASVEMGGQVAVIVRGAQQVGWIQLPKNEAQAANG